jgi:hypothetical protein
MQASASALWSWNWEGRIWIEAWNDVKWINLRATPIRWTAAVQWDGIMTNITESKLEQEEMRRSRARLAELTAHIEQVKEQERTRIAREIHDDLGGNLTAIKMALAMLAARLPADAEALREKADYLDAWSTAPSTRCTAFRWTCGRPRWTSASSPRSNGRRASSKSRWGRLRFQRPTRTRGRLDPDQATACSASSRKR